MATLNLKRTGEKSGVLDGTKYKYADREGLVSMKDKKQIEANRQKELEKMGDMTYAVKLVHPITGAPIDGASINLGGRQFTADSDGKLVIGDAGVADKRSKEYLEIAEYINKIIPYFIVNDKISADLLGIPLDKFRKLCGPWDEATMDKYEVSKTIGEADCSARILSRLTDKSESYHLGIGKLRAILEFHRPVIDIAQGLETTTKAAIEAGQE